MLIQFKVIKSAIEESGAVGGGGLWIAVRQAAPPPGSSVCLSGDVIVENDW